MPRPMQQQQSDHVVLNRIMDQSDVVLVEYQRRWYRVKNNRSISLRSMPHFNIIVAVRDNDYTVLKNRYTGTYKESADFGMVRMQMFASGITLDDLPCYYEDESTQPGGPLSIGINDEGDLVGYSAVKNYDATN
jgi:hypothetical protein